MEHTIFIGNTTSYIVFLSLSNQVHLFSSCPPFTHVNSFYTHTSASPHLDEHTPILTVDTLIMYELTRHVLTLQHYLLPDGALTHSYSHSCSNMQYDHLEIGSLDIMALYSRKNKIMKVLDVTEPVKSIDIEWWWPEFKVWGSVRTYNCFSDGGL